LVYKVVVHATAQQDILETALFLLKDSTSRTVAVKWLDGVEAFIQGLADMPTQYRSIPEHESFSILLRQAIFLSHRIVFHVNERALTVHVLRVYHGARRPLQQEDLPKP